MKELLKMIIVLLLVVIVVSVSANDRTCSSVMNEFENNAIIQSNQFDELVLMYERDSQTTCKRNVKKFNAKKKTLMQTMNKTTEILTDVFNNYCDDEVKGLILGVFISHRVMEDAVMGMNPRCINLNVY